MSNTPQDFQDPYREDAGREIAKWAERYARSRTLPFLVQWFFIVGLVLVIGLLSQGALIAYWRQRTTVQWIFEIAIAAMTSALMWFSISVWGREQIWRISQWLYGKEGYAAYSGEFAGDGAAADETAGQRRRMRWIPVVGVGLAVYLLIGAVLVGFRYIPMSYLQPFSAIFMLPFLALLIRSQRLGFWAWVWPALYGLHAILLLAGMPIHFKGQLELLDIIVPIFGYGLVSMIIGHVYSRHALHVLKRLARAGLSETEEPDDGAEMISQLPSDTNPDEEDAHGG